MEKSDSIELDIIDKTDYPQFKNNQLNECKKPLINDNDIKEEIEEKKEKNHKNELFGNDINIIEPQKIGNVKAYCYYKGNPLIIIGSDCKIIILLKYIL